MIPPTRRLRRPLLFFTTTLAVALATAAQADETAERDVVVERTEALLQAHDYAGLAQEESEFVQTKARTSAGAWKLSLYYKTINWWLTDHGTGSVCTDKVRDFVQGWTRATPNSPAATIAYASHLVDEAFCIRGDKFASQVDPKNWAPFEAYIEQARQYLDMHKAEAQVDPQWFVVMEQVANAQSWDKRRFMTLIKAAQAKEPLYYDIYFTAAVTYFLPQWNGSLEEIDAFARYAAKSTERWEGTGLYARIYLHLNETVFPGPFSRSTRIDWDLMKTSMEDVAQKYPNPWNINKFASLACGEDDWRETKYFMEKISGPLMSPPWRSEAQFSDCRTFAMALKHGFTGAPASAREQQLLTVRVKLSGNDLGDGREVVVLGWIEDSIERAVKGLGELDGHEYGEGFFTIYVYGRDVDSMYRAVAPVLAKANVLPGSYVLKRRGGSKQTPEKVMIVATQP